MVLKAAAMKEQNSRDIEQSRRQQDADDEASETNGSVSTISDSITRLEPLDNSPTPAAAAAAAPAPAAAFDGGDFLKHLRAAGAFDDHNNNQDTFGSSMQRNTRHDLSTLSRLFDSSTGLNSLNNEDTVGRSNRTRPQQKLSSLAELFVEPPTANKPDSFKQLKRENSATVEAPTAHGVTATAAPATIPSQPVLASATAPTMVPNVRGVSPPPSVLKTSFQSLYNHSNSNTSSNSNNNTLNSPNSRENGSEGNGSAGNDTLVFRSPGNSVGLPPRPQALTRNQHQRTVSWGNNTTFVAPPQEHDQHSNSSDGRRENMEPNEAPRSEKSFDSVSSLDGDQNAINAHRRNNTRNLFLSLDDLLGDGPYEAEAESNIIRALEVQQAQQQQQQQAQKRSSITSQSLLQQVPEFAAHDFSLDDESSNTGNPSITNNTLPSEVPRSPKREGDERVRLINNQGLNASNHTKKQPRRHRRDQSVEQTLVGLTNAMSMLHGTNKRYNFNSKKPAEEHTSSADAFAANAFHLSEHQEEGEPQKKHHRNVPSRVWQIDSLPMVDEHSTGNFSALDTSDDEKESSDDNAASEQHHDIEAGGNGETPPEDDGNDRKNSPTTASTNSTNIQGSKANRRHTRLGDAGDKIKTEWEAFSVFFRPRQEHIRAYIRNIVVYIMLPLTAIATILFYFCGNPIIPGGSGTADNSKPSVSWILLFAVREVITFTMALALQGLIVDFLALGTKVMLRLVGPVITLLIVQAKGWPFIGFCWAILDFALQGNGTQFAQHWLFWQNPIHMFNANNPSGHVASSSLHIKILAVAATFSAVVTVKRFVIGLYLGRQTFSHFGETLAKVMNSMLLISEVASLSKAIEKSMVDGDVKIPVVNAEAFGWDAENLDEMAFADDNTTNTPMRSQTDGSRSVVFDIAHRDPLTGSLPSNEKRKLMQLLGQWEEPDRPSDPRQIEIASISSVLRFRKALTFIQKAYPFGYAFGSADTRENCVESAQRVYNRLLLRTPCEDVLPFETLALLALDEEDDTIDQLVAKDLVKLFRPDRQGHLSMLDFLKSIDGVYKEFRMLNASIQNSSQIDRAFENIFNVVFYILLISFTLSVLGFNPLALFLSLSSIILAFAFMIGSASSKYFEGVLFILVRRPYGIGDRIHVSNVEIATSIEGSPGWVVENVTLFETIATWTPTQERCSLSNGSLANSRIINAARSPQAQFHVFFKFPIDTPFEKTLIFKAAIEEFVKARPREWLALNGFRAFKVEAHLGYVEYAVVIQHRESWQNVGQILDSKANLSSYCNEVAKQLNMHYRAPPLPVDLRAVGTDGTVGSFTNMMTSHNTTGPTTMNDKGAPANAGESEPLMGTRVAAPAPAPVQPEIDREVQLNHFRQIALSKHNIHFC